MGNGQGAMGKEQGAMLDSQFPVLGSQFSVPNSQFPIPNSHCPSLYDLVLAAIVISFTLPDSPSCLACCLLTLTNTPPALPALTVSCS